MSKVRVIGLTLAVAGGTAAMFNGCSSDEPSTPAAAADTGTAATDSATATGTLYDRLGKNAGIKAFIDAVVAEAVMDPEVASFFVLNGKPEPGHPSVAQIKECFVLQVGMAAGGPEVYPGKVSGDFTCRDMKTAHAGTKISNAVFDKFIAVVVKVATTAKVAQDDIAVLGAVLEGTRSDIVDPTASGPFVPPDAGGGG